MSTLTKVFVVLLVVFSIAFTSMTVSITTQTANWKQTAERFEQHARVADTNLRHLIASNSVELLSAVDAVNDHLDTIADLESQLQQARHQSEQRQVELRRAASQKSSSAAINRGLLAQLQSSETQREEYRTQRDELEKQSIDLQRRNIDLNDRVNELTARTAVFLEQRRQFEQQINILRAENAKLARLARAPSMGAAMEAPGGAAMANVEAVTPVAAATIRGRILEISNDIVTISVGSADGVLKDMVFVIHRDGDYVGDLQVSQIDPNRSAGRLVGSRLAPSRGDKVTDAVGLTGSRG